MVLDHHTRSYVIKYFTSFDDPTVDIDMLKELEKMKIQDVAGRFKQFLGVEVKPGK